MEAIAELVGLTLTQVWFLVGAGVVLVIVWYVLRTVLRIASRVFTIGCVGIVVLVGLLYMIYAFAQ